MTKNQAARIIASLRDQRLDVRLGLPSEKEWKNRVAAAVAQGVNVPTGWRS